LETTEWGYGTARGLRAAIGVSYARLSAEDQKFFAALGVFAGEDFDRDAAADVTESAPDAADKTLARLGRRSLVQAERHAGRFKLHPAWARYAREQLTDMDAERRMAAYYCALAQEQGRKLQGAEMHAAMAVLDAEVSNIFAGQAWARACNDSTGWVLCRDYIHGAMDHYFSLRSMWNDWIAWSITGLEACRKLGDEHNGAILANSLGMVYLRKGEWNQAIEFYQRARVALEKLGDWRALATIYMNLGSAQTQKGDWQNAIIALGRALQLHEQLGDLHGLAQARANLGVLYAKHGEKDKARANWNQALEIFDHLKLEHEADIVRKWLKAG
jgi:tetratricopeptide (TPR) repeat protein